MVTYEHPRRRTAASATIHRSGTDASSLLPVGATSDGSTR